MIIRENYKITAQDILTPTDKIVSVRDNQDEVRNRMKAMGTPDHLIVRVAGTHGGFINDNGFFYKPSGMKTGYHTWINPYPKPVLINHDTMMSPLGRVIDARFMEDSPEDYHAIFNRVENVPACHVDLTLDITDKDAIKKILDGSYLTVSQSCSCQDVRCSICDADVISDRCDHIRNRKTEDGERVFWKFGALEYKEISFVNVPSDQYAKVTSIGEEELVEDNWSPELEGVGRLTVVFTDSYRTQEVSVSKTTSKPQDTGDGGVIEIDGVEFTSEDVEALKMLDEQVETFMEVMKDFLPEDAQLSASQRKSLPSSAFCGPDRSFPVPDCAHVRAARRLIGRYKGSGDKSKILACVNRKARSMGCDSAEDNIADNVRPTLKEFIEHLGLQDVLITKEEADKAVQDKVDEYEDKIGKIQSELDESKKKVTEMETTESDMLISSIADLRLILGKISEDKYQEVKDSLKKRSLESLKDTLQDIRDEAISKELEPITDPASKTTQDKVPDKPKIQEFDSTQDAYKHLIFHTGKE